MYQQKAWESESGHKPNSYHPIKVKVMDTSYLEPRDLEESLVGEFVLTLNVMFQILYCNSDILFKPYFL